jgi:hypothetical protein
MKYKRGELLKIKKGANDCLAQNYRWAAHEDGFYKDFLLAFILDSNNEPLKCVSFPPDESFVIIICSKIKPKLRGRVQVCHPDAGIFYISPDLVEGIKPNEK